MSNLMRWKREASAIYNPFFSLRNDLEKVLENFYTCFDYPCCSHKEMSPGKVTPSVDIVEKDKEFKIEVEMPGMGEEDIKIFINKNILKIRGEKKVSKKDEDKNYQMREINYGMCERDILIPEDVDIEQARASFKKGMLWVVIPKKPASENQNKELKIEKV